MATGDNVLTAISVAGQCGIIDRQDQVYLGDLSVDQVTNKPFVIWTCQNLSNKNFSMQDRRENSSQLSDERKAFEFSPSQLPWDY